MMTTIVDIDEPEPVFVAVGAPLFEAAAMAAAAAAEAPAVFSAIALEERPAETPAIEIPATAAVEYAPEFVAADVAAHEAEAVRGFAEALEPPPAATLEPQSTSIAGPPTSKDDADLDAEEREVATLHPIDAPPPVDDTSEIEETTADLPESTMGLPHMDGTEPMVSPETPYGWAPIPLEMHMNPPTDSRYDEAAVGAEDRSQSWSAEAPEMPAHAAAATETEGEGEARPGVVPLARTPVRTETAPVTPPADAALIQTLQVAAARGAATVYVVAQSRPMIRIEGEISALETEPILTAADVDRLVLELAPPRRRDALQNGPVEWLCDVPEIGRVRCLTFRDHRGPGVIFRMFPPRAISADQLGLTPEVQALCQQSEGLVLVTGRARQRQVDAAQRVRRSHQPDAQRPCDHDRVPDRVRAREPEVVHQPARSARRQRARGLVRAVRRA